MVSTELRPRSPASLDTFLSPQFVAIPTEFGLGSNVVRGCYTVSNSNTVTRRKGAD